MLPLSYLTLAGQVFLGERDEVPEPMTATHEQHVDLDAFVSGVRDTLGTAVAVLSVADATSGLQRVVGSAGLPAVGLGAHGQDAVASYCGYLVDNGCQLVVDDVHEHEIEAHPVTVQLGIRAYAGWHVTGFDGRIRGVLCVLEPTPRSWTNAEVLTLMDLARECGPLVEPPG